MRFLFLLLLLVLQETFAHDSYLNVVLFLANYNDSQVDSVAYLNVSKLATIKPCNVEEAYNYRKCVCQQKLNESIFSLLNWARTNLEMATAVVTLKDNKNNNVAIYYSKSAKEPNLLTIDPEKQDFGKPLLSTRRIQKNEDEEDDSFIMVNAFPRQVRFHQDRKTHPQHYINLKRVQRTIGVPPIHHQVIRINANVTKPSNTISDIFGTMRGIRNALFANLINTFSDYDQYLDTSSLGKVQKRSLFLITEQVLDNLKSVPEKRGFLLVVNGGDLSTLDNPYSELVQSMKHILETCDNTLIVITSSCPKHTSNFAKIPVYASGPLAYKLNKAKRLLDISNILMEILRERNLDVRRVKNVDVGHKYDKGAEGALRDEMYKDTCSKELANPYILFLLYLICLILLKTD